MRPCERAVTQLDAVARKRARVDQRESNTDKSRSRAGARKPVRVRRGPATVTEYCAREPGTAPPAAATRDEDPEEGSDTCAAHHAGSRPGDPAAVHLGHRPAVGARVRCRLAPREPEPRHGPARAARPRRRGRGPRPRRAPVLGGGDRHRPRLRQAGRRARRRAGAGRGDDGAVDGPRGRRGAGAHLPRAGRPGEPRAAARLPVRHRAAHRPGLRTARRAAELGDPRPRPCPDGRADHRRPLLPRPAARGEHRLRRGAVHGRRGGRRPGPSRVLRVAAAGRARAPADAACGGRHGRHRARRRRHEARGRVGGRRRRGLGRRGAGRAGRPDPAGALPHHQPRHVGGQRRRPLAARRRDPGRRPRVRRPADHRAVLLQGVRRRRALGLRARPRARRPRRRHRRAPRPAAAHPRTRTSGSC